MCLQKTDLVMSLIDVQNETNEVRFGCRESKAREEAVAAALGEVVEA